jgi:L-cysteine desulfidase
VILRRHSKKETDIEKLCASLADTPTPKSYAERLKKKTLADLVALAKNIDGLDRDYIDAGYLMNLFLAVENIGAPGVSKGLAIPGSADSADSGDISVFVKVVATAATGARMAGVKRPAAASGGSGNQGIVAIAGPYAVGIEWGIDKRRIQEAIAFSQLINSYIKCYTGELSAMCGCAIAAGVGMAAALVYMRTDDVSAINVAINNVVGSIAGMLCDGAGDSCSLKVALAIDAAMLAASLALSKDYSACRKGIIGYSFEETIKNMAMISTIGMGRCDEVVMSILEKKQQQHGLHV